MKKGTASQVLSALFLAMVIVTVVYSNLTRPKIMILHSYGPDYSWTKGVNVGLQRVTDHWNNYSVIWYYMDAKKRSDAQWLERAGLTARNAIDKFEPDVLIAVDNLAQELAAKFYVDDPRIDIVFAGINGSIEPYGYEDANNVTGILELRQLGGLRETIVSLEDGKQKSNGDPGRTKPARVRYLLDASKSVLGDRQLVDAFPWQPLVYTGSYVARDWEDWKAQVLASAEITDYIIVTNYRQLRRSDADPSFVPANEVMTWTEANSPVPVVGLQVFNVEDGGMLAIGQSPYEQGEVAAKMAEDIVEKRSNPKDMPIKTNHHYIVAMRKSAMVKRGLELPQIYESFARATDNYYE